MGARIANLSAHSLPWLPGLFTDFSHYLHIQSAWTFLSILIVSLMEQSWVMLCILSQIFALVITITSIVLLLVVTLKAPISSRAILPQCWAVKVQVLWTWQTIEPPVQKTSFANQSLHFCFHLYWMTHSAFSVELMTARNEVWKLNGTLILSSQDVCQWSHPLSDILSMP